MKLQRSKCTHSVVNDAVDSGAVYLKNIIEVSMNLRTVGLHLQKELQKSFNLRDTLLADLRYLRYLHS